MHSIEIHRFNRIESVNLSIFERFPLHKMMIKMKHCQLWIWFTWIYSKSLSLKTYGCLMCGALVEVIKVEILLQKNIKIMFIKNVSWKIWLCIEINNIWNNSLISIISSSIQRHLWCCFFYCLLCHTLLILLET